MKEMSSRKSSLSHMAQQTTFYAFLRVAVVLLLSAFFVDCRICTRMTLTKKHKTETILAECITSYEARCSWFSTRMCVMNETIPCPKQMNRTYEIYRIVEDCCPGYQRNKAGKCISDSHSEQTEQGAEMTSQGELISPAPDVEKATKVANEASKASKVTDHKEVTAHLTEKGSGLNTGQVSDDDDGKFFLGISHGAYAGIVCGILFITCIAFLSALNYRKRRMRQAKMNSMNFEQEVAQKQQMIPIGPLERPEPPASPAVDT